jgi:hypothetical protein
MKPERRRKAQAKSKGKSKSAQKNKDTLPSASHVWIEQTPEDKLLHDDSECLPIFPISIQYRTE